MGQTLFFSSAYAKATADKSRKNRSDPFTTRHNFFGRVLVYLLLGIICGRATAQGIDPWRDPSLLRLVDGHMIGDHKELLEPPDANPRKINWNETYSIDSLHELHRLMGSFSGHTQINDYALLTKTALCLPLIGHDNGFQILLRSPHDLYTGLLEHYAKGRVRALTPIKTDPGYIAIDTHVHSSYSHDSLADISKILITAYKRGLAGVAITDHGTIAGGYEGQKAVRRLIRAGRLPANFFVITGEEVGSKDGHIIGLFLSKEIPAGMSAAKTIDAIHEQGGIAIAAHPLLDAGSLGDLARALPFDAVETKNGAEMLRLGGASAAEKERRTKFYADTRKPSVGASDSHDAWSVGVCHTVLHCEPNPDAVKTALLKGDTKAMCDIPEGSNAPQLPTKQKHSVFAFVSTLMKADSYLCRLTHANQADIAVWPGQGIRLLWYRNF